jgi:hypothetical protein
MHPKNIKNEYVVRPCAGDSTIHDSNNIDVNGKIVPTKEFYSLFKKLNNECMIFYDVMYRKKKILNEPFDLSMNRGANTCKTFTLLLLIQGELCFYNIHPPSNVSKKNFVCDIY